jgi:hypothetical protein
LIDSRGSGVDQYMSGDVAKYAKLYKYTGDSHYLEVARLLLHNTKVMLTLPGRTFGLADTPGFQIEHWSLAPPRGGGGGGPLEFEWTIPWIATNHLDGIFGLEELDLKLFTELSQAHGLRDRDFPREANLGGPLQ